MNEIVNKSVLFSKLLVFLQKSVSCTEPTIINTFVQILNSLNNFLNIKGESEKEEEGKDKKEMEIKEKEEN